METRVTVLRGCYGPHESATGAVFPRDVLRCRCGSVQRALGCKSFPCLRCKDGTCFAEPAKVGAYYYEGKRLVSRTTKRPLMVDCSRCGAAAGEPCRALGVVTLAGRPMESFHAARKRT